MAGGINLYQYAKNPVGYIDPLGLTPVDAPGYNVYGLYDLDINGKPVGDPYYVGITNDLDRRTAEHVDSGRLTGTRKTGLIPIDEDITYGKARGYEQAYIERYQTKNGIIGESPSATNRGNKYNSFDHDNTTRERGRHKYFTDAYNSKNSGPGKRGGGKCR